MGVNYQLSCLGVDAVACWIMLREAARALSEATAATGLNFASLKLGQTCFWGFA